MTGFTIILFDGFETLDAFGPAEIIGKLPEYYRLEYCSLKGGIVRSSQGIAVETIPMGQADVSDIILIPGGMGTRALVHEETFVNQIGSAARQAAYVLTVCTGAALLAKTGLLRNKNATTNKMAFDWVCSVEPAVNWQRKARWVVDEKYYTSSGVSAGMDMTLGFISDRHGWKRAQEAARRIEYVWNQNRNQDPFAV